MDVDKLKADEMLGDVVDDVFDVACVAEVKLDVPKFVDGAGGERSKRSEERFGAALGCIGGAGDENRSANASDFGFAVVVV